MEHYNFKVGRKLIMRQDIKHITYEGFTVHTTLTVRGYYLAHWFLTDLLQLISTIKQEENILHTTTRMQPYTSVICQY